jgi:SDR family mycofactocin-dependent oxidoreductase
MGTLDGKVAFITGAARGQGRSHAVRLAEEGADIVATDVCRQVETVPYQTGTSDDLATTAQLVRALGRRVVSAEVDVRDLCALRRVAEQGVREFGRLDIVLANAGIFAPKSALEMTEEEWSTTVDVNLTGVWKTIKATVPFIVSGKRGGSVVITSSVAALMASENTASYSSAKAGLLGFMRVLAKELASQHIRVNAVLPTMVATEMILHDVNYRLFRPDLESPTREDFEVAARSLNVLPIAAVEPVDVSNAVLYLVSESGRYITGTTQVMDAGRALR